MDIANLRGCFIDRALDHCCISLSSIAILAQEIQCVLACIRSHVWPRGYGVLAAFALLEARRPRSVPLHHVFGAALCESAFLHAGEHFGPHDGICVAGHSVPLPTALGFPGTASVAACSLGDGPPGRVVASRSWPVCLRALGTPTPQAVAPGPSKAAQTGGEATTQTNLPFGISLPPLFSAGTALPRIDLLRMLLATGVH